LVPDEIAQPISKRKKPIHGLVVDKVIFSYNGFEDFIFFSGFDKQTFAEFNSLPKC